ncbi:restriction endonuclease subunit S [Chryseobacterium gleum]|uniref:restriction endonuclease subunit S n=1 Tax=Chryseobacterium gleum TaxID=250 RepID=UPI001E40C17E|nr:restriction endonuclease subunit S [Chryseobacterium gleum]
MSYKRLGNYIRQVNIRNKDLETETLLGVSITKKLIPSIANTIGTDMSVYKVIEKRQFAYGTVTSRNGNKISIALSDQYDKALVSQIYIVFEVIDTNELLPEYLMMWFSRPEFDRYARFHSHGSTRETFDWEDMCEVELPIPSIEEQNKIVAQYQSVENKIRINEQICEKLETTAQTLYKHWFVDFEFPDERGQFYKSSGGKMVWNKEVEKEIPEGWKIGKLMDFVLIKNGKLKPSNSGNIPVYGGNGIIDYVDKSNHKNINIIGRVGAYCGSIYYDENNVWVSDNALAAVSINDTLYFDYLTLINLNLNSKSEGSSHPLLTQGILNNINLIKSNNQNIYLNFEQLIKPIFKELNCLSKQNQKLTQLLNSLLSQLAADKKLENVS